MDIDPTTLFARKKIGRDRQVRDMFRNGKVIDRKFDKKRGPLVRVQYLDKQGLISYWLPVKQFGSRKTLHYYCPKIGDDVNVTMLPNGSENGFVDGSFFNKRNPPPEGLDIDTRHFLTEDETVIEYREIDSTFNLVDKKGPALVKAVYIEVLAEGTGAKAGGGSYVKIHAAEYIEAHAGSYIEEHAGTYVEIVAGTQVTITAPEIILNGHMVFNGLITHTGDMTTTGVHTDANGIHMGGTRKEDEIEDLKRRVAVLENEVANLKQRIR